MADALKVVAKAFMEQYYRFLPESPKFVNRFYKDSSRVSWSGPDGVMIHVTTMKGISDHFLSFSNAKKFDTLSFDAQDFFDRGLLVLVIGCMTFKNDKARKFSQVFILVRQEEDYFVLNDVFRFLDNEEAKTSNLLLRANHEPTLIRSYQFVATDFVKKYYRLLERSPDVLNDVLRFYKDSSRVSRQGQDEHMSNVTTVKGISDHFISLSHKKYDILSYDAQDSFDKGIFIVVIGCMTLKNDEASKKFRQSFFLAPEENDGYFVLNDVFSFLDDEEALKIHSGETSDPLPSTSHEPATDPEDNSNNPIIPVTETSCSAVQKNIKPFSISAAENSETSASQNSNLNRVNALEGTTIFVGNLGREAYVKELTEAFKRFGPIKPNGVQIRGTREKGRYAFIEFESPTSAQTALQASSIRIGYRNVIIEARKPKK